MIGWQFGREARKKGFLNAEYYTLHERYRIGDIQPKSTVKKLGGYFSRYAYLHTFEISEVINRDTFPEFKSWFDSFLSGACKQIPEGENGIVHIGLESHDGLNVEQIREEKIFNSIMNFDPIGKKLQWIYIFVDALSH